MIRKVALVASTSLLMLGLMSIPAQAVETASVIDLNGIPGTRLDLCVGGQEVVSGLRYGGSHYNPSVAAGPATIVVRSAATGTCKGTRLFSAAVDLEAGKSYTIVYWKPGSSYKARVFTDDLALPVVDALTLTMRHAANTKAIDVWVFQQVMQTSAEEFPPTFNDLAKGAQTTPLPLTAGLSSGQQTLLEAFPSASGAGWTSEYLWIKIGVSGYALQAYLLGNARSNYRIVLLGLPGIAPTP